MTKTTNVFAKAINRPKKVNAAAAVPSIRISVDLPSEDNAILKSIMRYAEDKNGVRPTKVDCVRILFRLAADDITLKEQLVEELRNMQK